MKQVALAGPLHPVRQQETGDVAEFQRNSFSPEDILSINQQSTITPSVIVDYVNDDDVIDAITRAGYLESFQIEQSQSMEEAEGGFGEADRVVHEVHRAGARWQALMEQHPVESVDRPGQLRHLERVNQLRRVGQLLFGPLLRAGCLTAPNQSKINPLNCQ